MKDFLERLNHFEPARLRAFWVALVALLATLGVSVSTDVDARVSAAIALLAVLLPLVQGETTRKAVFAPATVESLLDDQVAADEGETDIPAAEMFDGDPVEESVEEYGDDDPPAVPAPEDVLNNEEGLA